MSEELFRKKSIDKMKSPENLNDYIRVSNPGVWLLLISIIVLLAGACIWGFFGHIDSTAAVEVHVEDGTVTCYPEKDSTASVTAGMTVKFAGCEGTIISITESPDGRCACRIGAAEVPSDGIYTGELVLEQIRPLSLLLD